jgi:hypothetical protein
LKWLEIVDAYHEVTGKIPCDGVENGAPATYADTEDGFMDGITYLESNDQDRNVLLMKRLRQVGLNPCTLISGNLFDAVDDDLCDNDLNVYEYIVNSINRGKETVTLGLTSFTAEIDDDTVHRNFIIFLNIPLDYAVRLDKLIDGYADGEHGKCLNLSNVASGTSNPYAHLTGAGLRPGNTPTSHPWPGPDNNSDSIDNLFALGIMLDY